MKTVTTKKSGKKKYFWYIKVIILKYEDLGQGRSGTRVKGERIFLKRDGRKDNKGETL
jgi:hypothetical protein